MNLKEIRDEHLQEAEKLGIISDSKIHQIQIATVKAVIGEVKELSKILYIPGELSERGFFVTMKKLDEILNQIENEEQNP